MAKTMKKKGKKVKNITAINIYLPNELIAKIRVKAKEQGLAVASYIRMVLLNMHKD